MKGSLTNSELHEFLHDFQSDETKENLEAGKIISLFDV